MNWEFCKWNFSKRTKKIILMMILVVITIMFGLIILKNPFFFNEDKIVINEICSRNFSVKRDENNRYSDYVELYNNSNIEVDLEEYYLSDDKENLYKYSLKDMCIGPKDFLVVWLDGLDDLEKDREGFRISGSGETIFLSKNQGKKIVDYVVVPELKYNTSYGRVHDGEDKWSHMTTTVQMSNENAQVLPQIVLEEPTFSEDSGFYKESFLLKMTAGIHETIYYTLDGSVPTTNSFIYEEPILIEDATKQENIYAARKDLSPTREYIPDFKVDKATVVRAISYDARNNSSSEVKTEVFFVGYENKQEYNSFPIISLVADPNSLFDSEYGIYVNGLTLEKYKENGGEVNGELLDSYTDADGKQWLLYEATNAFQEGKEWEREANFSYFDEEHNYCFSQNVGIRIAGASTRATPQKSFNIYGRDIYDKTTTFPIAFFEGIPSSTIKLRNGGNHNDGVKIIDAFVESLAEDRNISIQRSTPAVVFLNGEYWGIYNIRERYHEEYVQTHFGVKKDDVWIIDAGNARAGGESAKEAYDYFIAMATECDLSYDDVYEMVSSLIDVQSFIDYCCINLFLDNRDLSFGQNMALWRSAKQDGTQYNDGKWRWMLFDMDEAIQEYDDSTNPGEWMEGYCLMQEPVLQSFLQNESFRQQFCISFMDIANSNYEYDRVHEELMKWKEQYETQIVKNHRRFFNNNYQSSDFEKDILFMDDFFKRRFPFVMKALKEYFALDGTIEPVEISINIPQAGKVRINTINLEEQNWHGEYYTDFPISLTVEEEPGYRFLGWSGSVSSTEKKLEIPVSQGGISIQAEFEKIDEE